MYQRVHAPHPSRISSPSPKRLPPGGDVVKPAWRSADLSESGGRHDTVHVPNNPTSSSAPPCGRSPAWMNLRFRITHSSQRKGYPAEAEKSQPHSVALRVLPSNVLHK